MNRGGYVRPGEHLNPCNRQRQEATVLSEVAMTPSF